MGQKYDHYRQIVAKIATQRAELAMFFGTATGPLQSVIRSSILFAVMHMHLASAMLPIFTMLSIPYGTLDKVFAEDNF